MFFFIIWRFVRHAPERTQEDLAVAIRRFNFERNFSYFESCSTHFVIVISFVRNSVLISLYSVYFLQFLQAIPLHWIHSKFYLFIYLFACFQSTSYLLYYIAVLETEFFCFIFHCFEPYPYSYRYTIILTLKIYQSVVLKVASFFPCQVRFRLVSG